MTPFLKQVAETFYATYREEIQEITFVFPNRRAGIFFKKYLAEIIDGPLFSPTVTTVTDLFTQLSALQPADHIYLLDGGTLYPVNPDQVLHTDFTSIFTHKEEHTYE